MFKNGNVYEGGFVDDKMHGHGKFIFNDGYAYDVVMYEGHFEKNESTGGNKIRKTKKRKNRKSRKTRNKILR